MEHRNENTRVRLVFQRSGTLMKVVLIAAIVLSMAALFTLSAVRNRTQGQSDTLRAQAAALEEENRELEQSIDELGTVQSVKRIAREELDLVDPDTIVFEFGN